MTTAEPAERPERSLPQLSLTFVSAIHAAAFAWAAHTLPWNDWTTFAIAAGALSAAHAATAAFALVRARALRTTWRWTSIASLCFLAWCALRIVTTAYYLATLYDGLGRGVATAIFFASSGLVLFTLPVGCWGLARTGRPPSPSATVLGAVATAAIVAFGLWRSADAAHAQPVAAAVADPAAVLARTRALLPSRDGPADRPPNHTPPFDATKPAHCDAPVRAATGTTVVIHFLADGEDGVETRVHCAQGRGDALDDEIREILRRAAPLGAVKLDWVRAAAEIGVRFEAVEPLALRPGLDGVCLGARCLMPWQLVLTDAFRAIAPLAIAPDLQFGVSPGALRRGLGPDSTSAGLVRIEVVSLLLDAEGRLERLQRLRPTAPDRGVDRFDRAALAAERHVAAAQRRNGGFRYLQSPVARRPLSRRTNLPRQAGTTTVICELGRDEARSRRSARRSLEWLARHERRHRDGSFLVRWRQPETAAIGDIALPLIAFLTCRERVGDDFDALASRLGDGLLALQRPDGSFGPGFDLALGSPLPGRAPLYAEGQAIFALTLLERWQAQTPAAAVTATAIRAAVERAMHYVARDYWNHPLRDFFFIEENWHCLAAQASLGHHRNAQYERFCLDYTRFRSRFSLRRGDGVAWDFVGGLGFGNLLPPQTVPTAGFAESLVASIAILDAQGVDATAERTLLASTLDFLVDRQWTRATCFACPRPHRIVGGFSESMVSPSLRIDQTQHAWAAIGHGARILGHKFGGSDAD